jgi:hypothetical protein
LFETTPEKKSWVKAAGFDPKGSRLVETKLARQMNNNRDCSDSSFLLRQEIDANNAIEPQSLDHYNLLPTPFARRRKDAAQVSTSDTNLSRLQASATVLGEVSHCQLQKNIDISARPNFEMGIEVIHATLPSLGKLMILRWLLVDRE